MATQTTERGSSSTRTGSRGPGTTSPPTCRAAPPPPLHPGTGQPIGPRDLAPLFPMELIKQVVSTDREIEIPEPVRDAYALYRPSPLYRAHRLEKALDTPAHIYYKYEGGSPSGSHKPNTALAQAYYNKAEGVTRLATETGAGQWGSALAFAGRRVRPRGQGLHGPRELRPEAVPPDPDGDLRRPGRAEPEPRHAVRPEGPRRDARTTPARSGIAISEAIEDTVTHPGTKYSLGSVFDFVLLHQTVIGQESDRADGDGRRGAGRDHRLRRRRLELRRPDLPVARPDVPRRRASTGSSPPSPRRRRR